MPDLKDLILATFPCMSIETIDYVMVKKKIREALCDIYSEEFKDYRFCIWSITDKVHVYPLMPDNNMQTGMENPPRQIDASVKTCLDEVKKPNTAMVIMNPQKWLASEPEFIQKIIDTSYVARGIFSHIFLVGAVINLPPELVGICHSVDFPLPNKKELIESCIRTVVLPNIDSVDIKKPESGIISKKVMSGQKGLTGVVGDIYELNKPLFEAVAKSAQGLDSYSAENAFSLSLSMTGTLEPSIIQDHKRQAVRRTDVLEFVAGQESMEEVGGFENFKAWLAKRQFAFTDEAREFGVTPPKGILICGTPGTGKSLAAKATAKALNIPLLRFDMSKVFSMYVGSSEARMRNALSVAEAVAPAVIWLDEIEKAIAGSRGGGDGSGVAARVLGQFLQWRAETSSPVFICCTCNDVHAIPPEFYRPGRIDAIFSTDLPNEEERAEIFKIHFQKRGKHDDLEELDIDLLASMTEGLTGAEIELVVTESIFTAFNNDRSLIEESMVISAIKSIIDVCQSKRNKEEMEEIQKWASERATPVALPSDPRGTRPSGGIRRLPKGKRLRPIP